jgi:hypothetical protein
MDQYSPKENCPCCGKNDEMHRDFSQDQVYTTIKLSLDQIKTVGHYAERQTEQKGKYEVEKMREDFVTKKEDKPLPPGFSKVTEKEYIEMPNKKRRKGI